MKTRMLLGILLALTSACRKSEPAARDGASDAPPEAAAPAPADAAAAPSDAGSAAADVDAETAAADAPAPLAVAPGIEGPAATDAASGVRRLTPPELTAHRPRFSPDGTRILFFAGDEGAAEVYVIGRDGAGLAKLTDDPGDDRDPTWDRDGDEILWSTNRGGKGYDLWMMRADGSRAHAFTDIEGDELEPAVSPLRYQFFAVSLNGCTDSGAAGDLVDTYDKAAFTRRYRGKSEVWFQSLNVVHRARVSPEGGACREPAWSGSGLALAWSCEAPGGSVVMHSDAAWDQSFAAALDSVGATWERQDGFCPSDGENFKAWRDDPCFSALPRHYAVHAGEPRSAPAEALREPAYSANQILLLGAAARGPVRTSLRGGDESWTAAAGLPAVARRPVWSPDGAALAFESDHEGTAGVYLADPDFYLQEVRDLIDYPELYGAGRSDRLHRNRFVARPGTEKEFHRLYEQVRYRRRAVFVTADAALQVFHDEFAQVLRQGELRAMAALRQFCHAAFDRYAARVEQGSTDPHDRYLALLFGVPMVFLDAAAKAGPSAPQYFPDVQDDPEYAAQFKPVAEQLPALVPLVLRELPPALKDELRGLVDGVLEHAGFGAVQPPDRPEPLPVDFTQFAIRGHYAATPLAGYFVAVKWLGLVPLPLDASAFELQAWADATPPPPPPPILPVAAPETSPGIPAPPEARTLGELWDFIDSFIGAFLGKPVDATFRHLRQVRAEHPDWATDFPKEQVLARLDALVDSFRFRGLEGGLTGKTPALRCSLLPQRYGLDSEFFSRLSNPTLAERTMVGALDVLAGLGNDAARTHALAAEQGREWFDGYRDTLATLAGETAARPESYWATDLYHSWLAALATLARPLGLPPDSPLYFARTTAWRDRLLFSALAGYAQLKHDAVLYALQEMGGECDSESPVFLYVEQPVLPEPRGFVDPMPDFFRALAALAGRVYRDLAEGEPPAVDYYAPETWDHSTENAKSFLEVLARLADKELRGEPLLPAEYRWLRTVGGLMEALFSGIYSTDRSPPFAGADEGRLERGVALVTDVFTDLRNQEVLELGVGRIADLYVAVPDDLGRRLTQGGIYSYYEFRRPLPQRLTDETWGEQVEAGALPPLPAWSQSFLEPLPEGVSVPAATPPR